MILYSLFGLLLGFLPARVLRLNFPAQKAISIEVGMQNPGLGAALAMVHFFPVAAVPNTLFSVRHNISTPIRATWRGRRVAEESKKED